MIEDSYEEPKRVRGLRDPLGDSTTEVTVLGPKLSEGAKGRSGGVNVA